MNEKMKKVRVTITGSQPLLHHADSIEWADEMESWRANKDNKKTSKAGDDRTPAWRWLGGLYHDGAQIVIPTENIMRCLMEGGALVPTGKKQGTFKSQTQSGIMPGLTSWPLLINGKTIPMAKILKLKGEKDFEKHKSVVIDHGFTLFLKRARIGQQKHIRVRPRFQTWAATGELAITDEQITVDVLRDIFEMGGIYKGLGDWRPGAKTPGTFGTFTAIVEEIN